MKCGVHVHGEGGKGKVQPVLFLYLMIFVMTCTQIINYRHWVYVVALGAHPGEDTKTNGPVTSRYFESHYHDHSHRYQGEQERKEEEDRKNKQQEELQKKLQSITFELKGTKDELKATNDKLQATEEAVKFLRQTVAELRQEQAQAKASAKDTPQAPHQPVLGKISAPLYSNTRFDGSHLISSRYSASNGTDVYENVCIQHYEDDDQTKASVSIRNYLRSSKGKWLINPAWPNYKVNHWKWTFETNPNSWQLYSANATWIKEETLLLINMFRNPGHCLNDLGFATAMELLDNPQHGLQYERFLYFDNFRGKTAPNCNEDDPLNANRTKFMPGWSYCCQMMEAFGAIRPETIVHMPPHEEVMCFRKLVVPRLAIFRIPQSEKEIRAVQLLQQKAFDQMKLFGLTREPWPADAEKPTIFFDDRKGANRRKLANSEKIQKRLQEMYHVNVTMMRDWDKWTGNLPEQARIFNQQQYILQVHGGSNGNIFFSRPGTKVYEIQCGVPPKDTEGKTTVDDNNWQWFSSFARNISLDYYQYLEYDGCLATNGKLRADYSPNFVKVDVESLVESIGQHFGLKAMGTTSSYVACDRNSKQA